MTGIIRWKRHLSEAHLFECYLAERNGEGIAPPSAEHLADCPDCHGRYAELSGFMDQTRVDAESETSAIFTPDRLQQQRQEIARRLELLGHAGRVLTFRAGTDNQEREHDTRRLVPGLSRAAAGWVAAAAAAGLFVGVGAGMFYHGRSVGAGGNGTVMSQPAVNPEPTRTATPAAEPQDDDSILFSELEAALRRPRTPELMALDAMTPRVSEISYRIR